MRFVEFNLKKHERQNKKTAVCIKTNADSRFGVSEVIFLPIYLLCPQLFLPLRCARKRRSRWFRKFVPADCSKLPKSSKADFRARRCEPVHRQKPNQV